MDTEDLNLVEILKYAVSDCHRHVGGTAVWDVSSRGLGGKLFIFLCTLSEEYRPPDRVL